MRDIPSINVESVPSILVQGEAPDGKTFDLSSIYGEWLDTRTPDQRLAHFQSGTMTQEEISSLWQFMGRDDRQPSTLRVWLKVNPKFVNWLVLDKVGQFLFAKLPNRPRKELAASLQRAFAAGHIRTRNFHVEISPQTFESRGFTVEVNTRDFVKWIDYEYGIKASKYAVAMHPNDPTLMEILSTKKGTTK
jgi:hypothetical protein